jgi:O-acetylserine/cysteine efflux transporter
MSRQRALALLALVVVLFGASWPIMKVGLADATPLWFAFGRATVMASCVFAFIALTERIAIPEAHDWPLVVSVGLGQMAVFFAFSHVGLQHLPAGRGVVIAYSTPLWVIPMSWLLLSEKLGARDVIGCALGVAGLVALLAPDIAAFGSSAGLVGGLWLIGAAFGWALAIVHSRRGGWRGSALQLLPWQMGLAAGCLLLAAVLLEPGGSIAPTHASALALLALGVGIGPVGAWGASAISRALPAPVSAVGFLATPLIGVVISTLWLREPLGWEIVTGGTLMLAGLALAATRPWRRPPRPKIDGRGGGASP